ncbi:adenosylmethionine-8-amino-7-oxononanoate aminotransferase [Flexivirga endophytica]|uniref:Adenosylmethionine-8-amino-7-oxononanoate aminotransferase n=1 Tax=Flexivirga endophytica TaxID=1849103 RepID=A0A916TE45_9MICO|nr:adenosylmethionine--8-amino-7-oxononanoate transaminase [Flexivirga endophytica]GGB39134.1 adenosylmethionine-8-amino-7-oxononanoate aminotransferase [Flexivirga endophytica]GHB47107.1 adenosylmethionine-8-amino-7-oxononanoate aminotransferase [Flexivirga endophytica]
MREAPTLNTRGSGNVATRDRGLVWHPYAPLNGPEPYAVSGASGVRLSLSCPDGSSAEVVDAMASWWCAVHGYGHPALNAAAHRQIDDFSHVMFGGLTHEPAVELAERLVAMAPGPMAHVFYADSGSVSVEVALKLALQYQAATGSPQRQRFLTIRGGYHGDTFAAMSVCDPVDGMHSAFPGVLASHLFAPRPPLARVDADGRWTTDEEALDRWTADFRSLAATHAGELAAIVVEPVLQGAGGMRPYDPRCVQVMREVADEHGLLLIADEIATGFGRTGRLFACEWAGVTPDVMCVGKALTGGYLSLAAVLMTSRVGAAITGSSFGALLHGPTFMANPLACAVASASLDLLGDSWAVNVARVASGLRAGLAPALELASVREVRTVGAVGVIQLDRAVDVPAVTAAAVRNGVWVRPFRDLVYTMPPYVTTDDDIATICAGMVAAVREVHQ